MSQDLDETSKFEQEKKEAPEFLAEAAEIFATRNATYGASYQSTGKALLWLFGGKIPEVSDERAAQQLYLMTMCLIKLKRYAQNIGVGHADSADDLMVYAAMLREATYNLEKTDDGA